ncbi:MAG: hypothetical protein ACM3QS_15785 [Bacteroidota bacterium]
MRVLKSPNDLKADEIGPLYESFDSPIAALDCGRKCAPHNPSGKPFCCDICQAVPAAYRSEWAYLRQNTHLWHTWRAGECPGEGNEERARLEAETPPSMVLLACRGPDRCERQYRALNCRQFPFFPYVTSDYRFVGLAYEWEFESRCWVISNLGEVSTPYREQFIRTYDRLFALFQDEFEAYADHSDRMRAQFQRERRRFPLLHRNGGSYLVSPRSERLARVDPGRLPRFGPYR